MNSGNAASVNQVREHLAYYLRMMQMAAYEGEGPTVEASMDLMHAICMIHFFRGRAVELGIDNAPSEHDMEEMDSLAEDLARWAAKGHMSARTQQAFRSNGRTRRF
jgi:hypothetical protein